MPKSCSCLRKLKTFSVATKFIFVLAFAQFALVLFVVSVWLCSLCSSLLCFCCSLYHCYSVFLFQIIYNSRRSHHSSPNLYHVVSNGANMFSHFQRKYNLYHHKNHHAVSNGMAKWWHYSKYLSFSPNSLSSPESGVQISPYVAGIKDMLCSSYSHRPQNNLTL